MRTGLGMAGCLGEVLSVVLLGWAWAMSCAVMRDSFKVPLVTSDQELPSRIPVTNVDGIASGDL
jgi:hypothetical protein